MLTPNDLKKFKDLVEEAIEPLRADISEIEEEVNISSSKLSDLKLRVYSTGKTLISMHKDLADVKLRVRKLGKDLAEILDYLERDLIRHRDEIRKIGRHIGFPIAI